MPDVNDQSLVTVAPLLRSDSPSSFQISRSGKPPTENVGKGAIRSFHDFGALEIVSDPILTFRISDRLMT
jgi:hypothetical protein